MKAIIGVVGENGAGKETFITALAEALKPEGLCHIRTVAPLHEILDIFCLKHTRHNLQSAAIAVDDTFGKGTLARAIQSRIDMATEPYVAYDCIRWQADMDTIMSFPCHRIVYVTADVLVRWRRTKARGEKEDESRTTFRQFVAAEARQTETLIREFGAQADMTIVNNGGIEHLRREARTFGELWIKSSARKKAR